jgi:exosortase C (VPDSG-CTERM-specific)
MLDQEAIAPAGAHPTVEEVFSTKQAVHKTLRRKFWYLALALGLLCLCFAKPLSELVRFCFHSDLYSHILLVPFISLYLSWLQRRNLPSDSRPAPGWALLPFVAGCVLMAAYWLGLRSWPSLAFGDYLSLMTFSFLCFVFSAGFAFLGTRTLCSIAFPMVFLVFMIPFPLRAEHWIAGFLQRASADAAYSMLTLTGTPVFRQGMEFQLPGIAIQVAPECSGIHSSLVLFITSLLAGHLLLRRHFTRLVVVLAVIPLAILRNGFRIFLLAQLCIRLDPKWIHSDLHHRGGPVFFAASLIPFFLLLYLLRRMEVGRGDRHQSANHQPRI